MPLFDLPERASKAKDKSIASKSKKKVSTAVKSGGGLLGKINLISHQVETKLGKFKDDYIVIRMPKVLKDYIDACIENHYISIDTETTGLDPLQDELVGICIYTRGQKAAYIPVNHKSYVTGDKSSDQLTTIEIRREFERLTSAKVDIDMFNAKFDIRVLRANGINVYCTFDGLLAAKLMNENESHALKILHKKYCLQDKEDAFTFGDLFSGVSFDLIPIKVAYLYAAHDAIITTELCDYQRQYLYYDPSCSRDDRNGMNGVSWVFDNIEMPCIYPIAEMEDNGIEFDFDYQKELSIKYNAILKEKKEDFYKECNKYSDKINDYIKSHSMNCKLESPINIASAVQIAILLYDIIGVESVDKKKPRGTGEDILLKIDLPITKAILEYREAEKLVSTYIDKLPECVNPKDGRIHCNFNQYGAKTGRMSSSDPNLQNIPSHNKDIRKMFKASDGYVLMSSDFSQQEPKCLAAMCKQAGDPQMYETFMAGKDLYSEIASKAFNKSYEECLEFNDDGTTNKEGKERRTQAKSILLGVLYGRGEASVAEQLNVPVEKARAIKESVFIGFPAIKQFEEASLDMAYEKGYVTTVCGRKRRLPDLQLEEYEFSWKDGAPSDDDLLDFDVMPKPNYNTSTISEKTINYYLRKLHKSWGSEKRKIFEEANEEGIWIVDNGAKISDAERQCVNSRIQGSAADLTKLAMIDLNNNERLKELGFRLLIPVHDEIIAECPKENAKECSELLAGVMSKAAEKILEMPVKCDVAITNCWYGESVVLD